MSTFPDLETSVESSRPAELYEFTLGTTILRYTSSSFEITVGSSTFSPEPGIRRGNIVVGADQKNRSVDVTVEATNEIATRYIGTPPGTRAAFKLFRTQLDETPALTSVLIFSGLLEAVKFDKNATEAVMKIRSLEASLLQQIPRIISMPTCNNFLYDERCQVDPAMHNLIGVAGTPNGRDLPVSGVGASSLDFVGGFVQPVTGFDFRQVRQVNGDVLTLDAPFSSDPTGQSMQVFEGCNHIIDEDCALKFDNVINFVGNPFVPQKNIFESGLD